jgi:tetratricopeptide (TPR) repeat protein
MGVGEQARDAYMAALTIRERLAGAAPQVLDLQRDLCVSYDRLSDLYRAQGQLDASLDACLRALATARLLAAAEPDRADYQRNLSVSYSKVGNVHRARGEHDLADAAYAQSLEIADRLAAAEPERADYQRDLVIALMQASTRDAPEADARLLRASAMMDEASRRRAATPADSTVMLTLDELLHARGLPRRGDVPL